MISLCLNTEEISEAIYSVSGSDYIKSVMCLYLHSYGTDYQFSEFYLQYNNDVCTAVISRYNTFVYVICNDNADFNEISAFLCSFSGSRILYDSYKLNFKSLNKCYIMSKNGIESRNSSDTTEVSTLTKAVASLVCKSMNISDETDFYLNLSHQVRHGNLSVFSKKIAESVVSVAGVSKEFSGVSAVTFVYTDEYFRGNGFSREVLDIVCCNKNIKYTLVCEEHNIKFYEKCGFMQEQNCYETRL